LHANTIDEVIVLLKAIIETEREKSSTMAYFTILYHDVTVAVREAIVTKRFEDNARMEKLDVIFANHYFDAYQGYLNKRAIPECWQFAFESTTMFRPTILQHILAGMNAHINYDLSQAVIACSPEAIIPLQNDFMQVNIILSEQVDAVQDKLANIWPLMKLLDWIAGRTDEAVIDFSMFKAREAAWENASELFAMSEDERVIHSQKMDDKGKYYADKVINPPYIVRGVTFLIRVFEGNNVEKKIERLYT